MSASNINNDIEEDNRESGHGKNLNLITKIKKEMVKNLHNLFCKFSSFFDYIMDFDCFCWYKSHRARTQNTLKIFI